MVKPPRAACEVLNAMDEFNITKCQKDFCPLGVDGHVDFAREAATVLAGWMTPIGATLGSIVMVQLVYAANVRNVRRLVRKERKLAPELERQAITRKKEVKESMAVRAMRMARRPSDGTY